MIHEPKDSKKGGFLRGMGENIEKNDWTIILPISTIGIILLHLNTMELPLRYGIY